MQEIFQNFLSNLPLEKVPNTFVVLLGIGTVFIALIAIIILCKIIGLFFKNIKEEVVTPPSETTVAEPPIQNRQEIIAAVSAVIAEELGADVSAIRIKSFKRI